MPKLLNNIFICKWKIIFWETISNMLKFIALNVNVLEFYLENFII